MSNLESVGKLRRCAYPLPEYGSAGEALRREYGETTARFALTAACDEIEREVAERFVELPVDADGAPIHVGDELYYKAESWDGERFEVAAVLHDGAGWQVAGGDGKFDAATLYAHYRKPTPEGVLEEFYGHCQHYDGSWCSDWTFRDAVRMYAGKLREAMGE